MTSATPTKVDTSKPGITLTREYSAFLDYAVAVQSQRPNVPTKPMGLPYHVEHDLIGAAAIIIAAWKNPYVLEYSIADVLKELGGASKLPPNFTIDEHLHNRFPSPIPLDSNGLPRTIDRPCVFIDSEGKVAGWYLPGVFGKSTCYTVYNACCVSSKEVGTPLNLREGGNWRAQSFADVEKCVIKPSNVNMSACWYGQGHPPPKFKPGPSVSVRSHAAANLNVNLSHAHAIMGAVLSAIHPKMYDLQSRVLEELLKGEFDTHHADDLQRVLQFWTTPFSAYALIANRETILHRDTKGGKLLYDMLAAFGLYNGGRFEVPLLGRFIYNPGTILSFPGAILQHGASRTNGERICLAHYVRPIVGQQVLPDYEECSLPEREDLAKKFGIKLSPSLKNPSSIWKTHLL